MTITHFGRPEHRLLSPQIIAALKELGDRHGVNFSIEGGQIGSKARFNLWAEPKTPAGGKSHAQREFEAYAAYYGLKPEHFGKTFISQGSLYRISGIKPSAPKYQILAERVTDGTVYKFTARGVLAGLPKEAVAA